ncbi:hypothetical protein Tco_0079696 [Tanacetum coccineum]
MITSCRKAQQLETKLYDGNVIKNTSAIVILDSKETLMLAEESHFETRFVPQTELSAEQAFFGLSILAEFSRIPLFLGILDGFQDLLTIISKTCPRPITSGEKKVQEIKFRNNRKGVYKYWIHLETYWSDLHHSRKLACPLTRITTTTEVPFRNLTALENETSKPVVTLIYLRKPRKSKTNVPVSKTKVLKSLSANNKEPSQSWGSIVSNVPSSLFDGCSGGGSNSKLFSSI